ncbi:UDP-2,4-diacetamido-2,4,6-trideoxy-beta-L-altropyranose hydrolase [Hymenobacter sp. B81]|uniref:UDP-2,4-diacetamido-2,4, 6-trideoxy-beta-L-altropyranose hydrolase n=1 Tax=Hymenobacter sp. B81 TaxID=3344878 RepID=UPI0037DD3ECE
MPAQPAARLVLRADGNSRIGLGHVVRLLALADMVRGAFAETLFAAQQPPQIVRQLIAEAGLPMLELPEQPAAAEAQLLAARLSARDVLVLDGYDFQTTYQLAVRASGCRLAVVDDLRAWPTAADLLINHAPGIAPTDYEELASTRYCLGPEYSLLRRQFRQSLQLPAPVPHIESVLLCFGGADPERLTHRCLVALLGMSQVRQIGVVLGGAFAYEADLHELTRGQDTNRVRYHRSASAEQMLALYQTHDAVVCPASTVLLEALLLGRAAVTGYYVDNQRHLAEYVQAHRQAYSVGDFSRLSSGELARELGQGFRFHESQLRQPYVTALAPAQLRAEFARLAAPR